MFLELVFVIQFSFPVSVFNLWHEQLTTLRATSIFVCMHSGIVNGYQLLSNAHTVLEPGELQLYFYFTHYRPFPLFLLTFV